MSVLNAETNTLTINGEKASFTGDVTQPLSDAIRERLGLTGTKIGCRTGECGACTVLMDGKPVVSCLIPTASAEGSSIVTIEKLKEDAMFRRLVDAMMETGGVQCGFCTPGIMMTLHAYLQDPGLFGGDIGAALKNNLCRCTGYQSIFRAAEMVIASEKGGA
jgi:aerobic-type carbon monoxide dehydrogenase small subunit (CoxS/CutS family)